MNNKMRDGGVREEREGEKCDIGNWHFVVEVLCGTVVFVVGVDLSFCK